MMDSNEIEQERGITILAKNTAITWNEYRINIVDTPGHADFGGEVERVLSMVDSVLLLVDAVDGPMPQTRFVTSKAFAMGFTPVVVINKIDRPGARPDWALDQTFELFDKLGATDEQLDFPVVYASAINGYAGLEEDVSEGDMTPLFQAIVDNVKHPDVDPDAPFQMQVSQLDYNSYTGLIGIGRIKKGKIKKNSAIKVIDAEGNVRNGRILQPMGFHGLERINVEEAQAGDIIAFTGMDKLHISDTLCDPDHVEALPAMTVDEPTSFCTTVALRVEPGDDPEKFKVSGRGELHLGILIENMRREGFELAVSRPEVVVRGEGDNREEPYENLTIDIEELHQGSIMEKMGERKGALQNMEADGKGRVRLEYNRSGQRISGVLVANAQGKALAFAIFNLQERGKMFIEHAQEVYEGQVIGIHSRDNDLVVNPLKAKQLNNIRAAGTDENLILVKPIKFTLEQALEFIDDDELVEITPESIRIRKRVLQESMRKAATRNK
ncbi:GTP-binding protein TypA/BipA [Nymphon striatum]|nr:GTP-binding protein TypA/BipA [Nymphon striatum]